MVSYSLLDALPDAEPTASRRFNHRTRPNKEMNRNSYVSLTKDSLLYINTAYKFLHFKSNTPKKCNNVHTETPNLIKEPDFDAWLIREVTNDGQSRDTEVEHL